MVDSVIFPHLLRWFSRVPQDLLGCSFLFFYVITFFYFPEALVALFVVDEVYRKVVVGAAIWYAAGLAYFFLFARKRLVFAPAEAFAMGVQKEAGEASASEEDPE